MSCWRTEEEGKLLVDVLENPGSDVKEAKSRELEKFWQEVTERR